MHPQERTLVLPAERLVHACPQRIMFSTPLLTVPLLTLTLRCEMTPALTFHTAALRQVQDPPCQTRNFPLALAFLVDGVVIVIFVLALAGLTTVSVPSARARSGRRLGELSDGRYEDGGGADVVHELFVARFEQLDDCLVGQLAQLCRTSAS